MDTKALRQKILDLAIRGKLVPQDPNDEPASVLLERIRAEKQQMVKEGKLKPKDIKNDTVIFKGDDNLHYEQFADGTVKCIEDEIPFELPEGWEWTRLGVIGSWQSGATPSRREPLYYENGTIPWLKTGDLCDCHIKNVPEYITEKAVSETSVKILPVGTVLIAMYGATIGKTGISDIELTTNQACCACVCEEEIYNEYLLKFLQSQKSILVSMGEGGAQPNISKEKIINIIFPLPPFNEQKKIVSKIEDFDRAITSLSNNKDEVSKLLLIAKSKILDLAICGKLVPQDPNDEPASVLLERIRAEKEELIKQGKIKRDKKESVIFKGDDNSYYIQTGSLIEELGDWSLNCLPDSWGICCLGEVCDYGSCVNVGTDCIEDNAWILDLEDIEKDTGRVIKKVKKSERSAMSTKHSFKKGQVLYSKLRPYLNKVVLADEDGYCTSEILPLDFNSLVLPAYARYYLMTPAFLAYANRCSYGVKMPRLSTSDGKKAVMTIPPLAEQKRIVAAIETYYSKLDKIAEMLT
jgi:type I restriction enzyme S subunit